jgi:hypothetical protein
MGICASSLALALELLLPKPLSFLLVLLRPRGEVGGRYWQYGGRLCLAVNGETKAGTWLAERRSTL